MSEKPGTLVLLVEDNEVNAELARALLARGGFEVLHAATAAAAYSMARDAQPDLILMDLQLPDGEGLSVVSRLRADPDIEQPVIIALTAYAMAGDEAKTREAGCDGYITKPFDTRSFTARMRSIMADRSSQKQI